MDLFGFVDCPLWVLLVLVCAALLLVYGYHPMSTWKQLGVPGPPPLPFIGNVHQFLNPKIGLRASVSKWQKQYGKTFGIQYFRKPCLVVTDPDLFNDILVKDFNIFYDRFSQGDTLLPDAVRNGLAFQSGKDWKRNRRIMTPTFTMGKLKLLTGDINVTARYLADKLEENARKGTETNAKMVFAAFSLDAMARVAFGLEINCQKQQDGGIYDETEEIFKTTTFLKLVLALSGVFPFLGKCFRLMNISLFAQKSIEYFKTFFEKLINERKNHPEQFKKYDLFTLLLNAEAEENVEDEVSERMLRPKEIVCHGITFIMAGYETTSSTMQFLSHILANNPDVQDKLVAEIKMIFPHFESYDQEIEVSYEHCQKLKYMEAVFNETMRLYPPVLQVKREAKTDTTLRGIPIPKNAGIIIPIYNIGRDPEIFPDPNSFQPERFLPEGNDTAIKSVHFLPFGFGPRQCIGMRLALVEMKIALVHVLRKVRFQNVQPRDMKLQDYTGLLTPEEPFRLKMSVVQEDGYPK